MIMLEKGSSNKFQHFCWQQPHDGEAGVFYYIKRAR